MKVVKRGRRWGEESAKGWGIQGTDRTKRKQRKNVLKGVERVTKRGEAATLQWRWGGETLGDHELRTAGSEAVRKVLHLIVLVGDRGKNKTKKELNTRNRPPWGDHEVGGFQKKDDGEFGRKGRFGWCQGKSV